MAASVKNPFILTPFVPEEYFCDREKETALLCKHILNGRNVALFADRRLGKTGLVRHGFEQKEIKDNFNTFLVDIYSAGSLKEMTSLFAKEVFSTASTVTGLKDRLLKGIKSIKPTVEFNQLTSTVSFSAGIGDITEPERSIEEILAVLDSLKKPTVIAIDEFQTIQNFKESNVEAFLRTAFQKCKRCLFIYTGSINHSINNIFKSPDKPFYNSAVMMTIDVIDREVYREFAQRMFRSYGKDIDEGLVYKCYDYFDGITWYNQLLMNEAFAQTERGETIDEDSFDSVYEAIITQQDFSYRELFSRFSEKQKTLLMAIAREGKEGASVTSQDFMTRYSIGPTSSIQTACSALKKNNFISDNGSRKQITDLIFRDWLRKN